MAEQEGEPQSENAWALGLDIRRQGGQGWQREGPRPHTLTESSGPVHPVSLPCPHQGPAHIAGCWAVGSMRVLENGTGGVSQASSPRWPWCWGDL